MDSPIEHIVVLMLENRSFDHMLGFLDHPSPRFPKLTPGMYSNPEDPADPASRQVPVTPDADHTIELDPPHSHESVMQQVNLLRGSQARMDGFIAAYTRKARGQEPRPVVHWWRLQGLLLVLAAPVTGLVRRLLWRARRFWPLVYLGLAGAGALVLRRLKAQVDHVKPHSAGPGIMRCMAPEKIPVLATLAKEFAVCTRWHCSVPGETWPNRNFIHAATSEDTVNIELGFYEAPTVFEMLERHGGSWRAYHAGQAQLWAFWNLWRTPERVARWDSIGRFEDHVAADKLATYSFIEPDHDGDDSNSQHPNNNRPERGGGDFVGGEALIARIYDALRSHPDVFAKTMLVITYDEHGGLFDHVPPPTDAAAPAPLGKGLSLGRRIIGFFVERNKVQFRFGMLGPRVPTVIVSPWVRRATIDDRLYDHSSVVATVRKLFAPGAEPLTARDAAANSFEHLVSLSAPRPVEDLPEVAPPTLEPAPVAATAAAPGAAAPPDEFTLQLAVLAERVRAELDARGVPAGPSAVAGNGAATGTRAATMDDVAWRFQVAAEQARQREGKP